MFTTRFAPATALPVSLSVTRPVTFAAGANATASAAVFPDTTSTGSPLTNTAGARPAGWASSVYRPGGRSGTVILAVPSNDPMAKRSGRTPGSVSSSWFASSRHDTPLSTDGSTPVTVSVTEP